MNKLKYVLLLGGTGAMGQFLVELFQKRNDIMCFVTSRKQREDGPNIKYLFYVAYPLHLGVIAGISFLL